MYLRCIAHDNNLSITAQGPSPAVNRMLINYNNTSVINYNYSLYIVPVY